MIADAAAGDIAAFVELLDKPMSSDGLTQAVLTAAAHGKIEILEAVRERVGPRFLQVREHLALRMASRRGDIAMLKFLLASGSPIGARGGQVMRLAAIHRHDAIVDLCAQYGCALFGDAEIGAPLEKIALHQPGPVVFLHLAKTAGTSLGALLLRMFPASERLHYRHVPGLGTDAITATFSWRLENVVSAFGALPPERQRRPILIGGHFSARLIPHLSPSRFVISMLRDPIERALSVYHYYFVPHQPEMCRGGIDEFFRREDVHTRFGYLFHDHQVRVLSGKSELDPDLAHPAALPSPVQPADVEAVMEMARSRFVLLGLTEQFDHSVVHLARQMGWPLTAMIDRRHNVTEREAGEVVASDETRALIAGVNRNDLALWQQARSLLQRHKAIDEPGFERDLDIYARLMARHEQGAGYPALLAYEHAERGIPDPRLQYFVE